MMSCAKACEVAPEFCRHPRLAQDSLANLARVYSEADILICFLYLDCLILAQRHRRPFILYDDASYGYWLRHLPTWAPVEALRQLLTRDIYATQRRAPRKRMLPGEVSNLGSFGHVPFWAREGQGQDVVRELTELLAREDLEPQSFPETRLPSGLVLTTNVWQSEVVFFLTGVRVPSVRP